MKSCHLQQHGCNLESPTEQKQVREEEILFDIPSLRTLRRNDTNELTEQKQTHWLPEQGYSCCREGWGAEIGWDGHVHSTIFKTDNQQGPTVLYMELCSVLCGSLDGKELGGEWVHIYVWLSPFAMHLNLSQHCVLISYGSENVSYLVMSDSLWPLDCSPPGSCVHIILQAKVLQWIAIPFSMASSRPRDQTKVSCIAGRFFTTKHQGSPNWLHPSAK